MSRALPDWELQAFLAVLYSFLMRVLLALNSVGAICAIAVPANSEQLAMAMLLSRVWVVFMGNP